MASEQDYYRTINGYREAAQGADKPVSSVLDNWRNQIDRYEHDGTVQLVITVHKSSPKTRAQVEAWYWQHVGHPGISSEPDGSPLGTR